MCQQVSTALCAKSNRAAGRLDICTRPQMNHVIAKNKRDQAC